MLGRGKGSCGTRRAVAGTVGIGFVVLGLVGIGGSPPAVAGSYSGQNGSCLDYNALYLVPGVHGPDFRPFPVQPGRAFFVTADSGIAYVEFYDAEGNNVGASSHTGTGRVPNNAVLGAVCVTAGGFGWPDLPDPYARWWYFD